MKCEAEIPTRVTDSSVAESDSGFSLIELLISMVLTMIILGVAILTYSSGMKSREEENSRTDALTSAQAALNVMSREISNSGFGLTSNGIVVADSNIDRVRFRANISADDLLTNDEAEDITYFYDADTQSILRYDPQVGTSAVVNRISRVEFRYLDRDASGNLVEVNVPSANTTCMICSSSCKLNWLNKTSMPQCRVGLNTSTAL